MSEQDRPADDNELVDDIDDVAPDDAAEVSIDEVAAEQAGGAELSVADQGRRPWALNLEEANELAGRRRQTVLVLAGDTKCGKTSVYAAIYERLCHGAFAGWQFAGSATIPGFEARCHYWRVSANTDVPGMRHTQAQDLPWLHLQMATVEEGEDRLELLLGDFDGEYFRQLLRNQLQPHHLPFLRRADYVGLVVDGERIADPATRPAEAQKLRDLTDALLKEPLWRPPTLLFIVTKLDKIDELSTETGADDVEQLLAELHGYVSNQLDGELPSIRLAVRSLTERFPIGHGLEALLEVLALRPQRHLYSSAPQAEARVPVASFRA